jgi:hypothetical protein
MRCAAAPYKDLIRVLAEDRMGCQIPPEEWTPEERTKWKQILHGELYGTRALNGRPLTTGGDGAKIPAKSKRGIGVGYDFWF